MKIILIRYHDRENVNTRLPHSLNKVQGALPFLGIAYVAAVLEEAGHEVRIIDAVASNFSADDVKDILNRESPGIVGVTTMISNVRGALEAAKLAKEAGAITVLGGPLLSIYPTQTLSYDFVDYGIFGEGEHPMVELTRAIERRLPVNNIKGLIYKDGERAVVNQPYIVDDLDSLPFPARHLLPMERYSSIIALHPVTTMIASRGCPYRCGFCIKGPSDKKFRVRNYKSVVDEMELVVNKYKVREIMFYDDTITLKKDFIAQMCDEILKRNLRVKWECPARVDTVDLGLLRLMNRAGCRRIRYGVESGDADILKLMRKAIDLGRVRDVFKWTKAAGIETFAYFIIGYIHETPQTIRNTISFARDLDPDTVMFTIATPYPATPLFEMAKEEGHIDASYWEEFVLNKRDDRASYLVPDAEMWIRRAYRSFYFRWSYILKHLFKIRSWTDFKKHFQSAKGLFLFRMSEA